MSADGRCKLVLDVEQILSIMLRYVDDISLLHVELFGDACGYVNFSVVVESDVGLSCIGE